VIALKYSENDVNESFSLFVFDEASGRFKPSSVKMVTNPEFLNDKIISEYMDGPKSRKDTACYSINAKDFFFCEQREQFSEKLERVETCNEKSCAPPVLVRPGEAVPVRATVAIEKAHFYEKKSSESFDQKQSYLIKGDKVVLNDYHRGDEGLFYQVTFFGKKTVTAWLLASAILIDEYSCKSQLYPSGRIRDGFYPSLGRILSFHCLSRSRRYQIFQMVQSALDHELCTIGDSAQGECH
jgi:hypothetical protein